ncbi:molybdopterin-binding protein [Geoglobus acetivorans]|uniref:Competence/damage-inducible protein A n=1 Tax=Geoglobus acetivorans TaxID=565033 RepID=A0ABZ3H5V6_GEOAI|nr:competence/damage-inducible protein A [Geoglobus acetivorans]
MKFAILVVGNEILSGEVQESNANYIAKKLTMMGHRVERIVTVPDRVEDIAEELKRLLRYDFVFVTGGLGATHDDVTAEGIARAIERRLIHSDEVERFVKRWTDKREVINKVSQVPMGAEIIENSVGVVPAFVIDKVAALPGVPNEMRDTFGKIVKRFSKEDYHVDYLRIDGYEENIVNQLHKVVEKFPEVEIGSYPKPGYVLVKFSGRDPSKVAEAKKYLESLL